MADSPDPDALHPIPSHPRVMFIKNLPDLPSTISIGAFTYYDDPAGPEAFRRNVLYHFEFTGDRLIIGKFCAIATGVRFMMNGANHRTSGLSTYPFAIFDSWRRGHPGELQFPHRGDTVIGNDVWIGYEALIMPGVSIGDGAIIGARAVVTRDVPPYAIVVGNPGRVIRTRFDAATITRLLELRWWDWPPHRIARTLPHLIAADLEALVSAADDPTN